MAAWNEVEAASPELAKAVRARFDAHGLGFLATLRQDGSPRICGVEPLFHADELWLGMMPDSRKGADLRRDPRLSLHAATVDKDVNDGDAKLSGIGVFVTDEAVKGAYRDALETATGFRPETFDLFRVDVTEISLVQPDRGELSIRTWTRTGGTREVRRR